MKRELYYYRVTIRNKTTGEYSSKVYRAMNIDNARKNVKLSKNYEFISIRKA